MLLIFRAVSRLELIVYHKIIAMSMVSGSFGLGGSEKVGERLCYEITP